MADRQLRSSGLILMFKLFLFPVPCEPPVIQRYQNSSVVEVPYVRRFLLLICEARNGRPAAKIKSSGLSVQIISFFSVPCESPVIQGYQNGSVVEVPDTCRFLLLICEARNGRPVTEIEWSDFNLQIISFFPVPFESPVIQRYQNSSLVEVPWTHRSLLLTCEARNGQPAAEIRVV